MMHFVGGKDNRKAKQPASDNNDDGDKLNKLRRPAIREGTFSNADLKINADSTWSSDESGGHHFAHSRCHNSVKASGTYKKSSDGSTFEFTVVEYEQHSSDRRTPIKDRKGETVLRSSDEIQSGKTKSFFFDIEVEKK